MLIFFLLFILFFIVCYCCCSYNESQWGFSVLWTQAYFLLGSTEENLTGLKQHETNMRTIFIFGWIINEKIEPTDTTCTFFFLIFYLSTHLEEMRKWDRKYEFWGGGTEWVNAITSCKSCLSNVCTVEREYNKTEQNETKQQTL